MAAEQERIVRASMALPARGLGGTPRVLDVDPGVQVAQEPLIDYPVYRTGRHNPALVYRQAYHGAADELVAVFVEQGGEHELSALHYARAMNATMPGCTCRVVCCCGALVGTTSGCETCAEHNVECVGGEE